jgi:hypothetical protein
MRRLLTSPPHVPIEGRQLTSWSVLSGGTQIAIDMVTQDSGPRRIVLPVDSLLALMMTRPRMLQCALDQRFPDGSLGSCSRWGVGTWNSPSVAEA